MSLEVFCIVFLLFFLFGVAVSASEEDYYYRQPRKLMEPNNMPTPYSRGYAGHLREEEE